MYLVCGEQCGCQDAMRTQESWSDTVLNRHPGWKWIPYSLQAPDACLLLTWASLSPLPGFADPVQVLGRCGSTWSAPTHLKLRGGEGPWWGWQECVTRLSTPRSGKSNIQDLCISLAYAKGPWRLENRPFKAAACEVSGCALPEAPG